MDKNQLERLLSLGETSFLDFKSDIDLESKRGKIKFIIEVLGLSNSFKKPAYLILGIEDSTKRAIGISKEITEERIQKVISDNCRPQIRCTFEYVAFKRKRIGILTIWGTQRPYTLKKDMGYEDDKGRQQIASEKTVYVRRGSTGDTANPDEIAEMFFERQVNQDTPENFEDISNELDRISTNLHHINDSIDRLNEIRRRERTIEYIFIGIVSGLTIGLLQSFGIDWKIYISGIFVMTFWISILASALRLVRFGWMRSVLVSLVISVAFVALSILFDGSTMQMLTSMGFPSALVPVWSGIKGMIGGITAAFLGRGEYEYD